MNELNQKREFKRTYYPWFRNDDMKTNSAPKTQFKTRHYADRCASDWLDISFVVAVGIVEVVE